jgi:hypothetical protein
MSADTDQPIIKTNKPPVATTLSKAVIFLSEKPRPEITYAFMREWTVSGPLAGDDTWLAAMFRGEDLGEINDAVFGGEFAVFGDLDRPIPHYVFTPHGHDVDIVGMLWMAGRGQPIGVHPNKLFVYQFFRTNKFRGISEMVFGGNHSGDATRGSSRSSLAALMVPAIVPAIIPMAGGWPSCTLL